MEQDHFLLVVFFKKGLQEDRVQLSKIFRQSHIHRVNLHWCELHDSESPGRQP